MRDWFRMGKAAEGEGVGMRLEVTHGLNLGLTCGLLETSASLSIICFIICTREFKEVSVYQQQQAAKSKKDISLCAC